MHVFVIMNFYLFFIHHFIDIQYDFFFISFNKQVVKMEQKAISNRLVQMKKFLIGTFANIGTKIEWAIWQVNFRKSGPNCSS